MIAQVYCFSVYWDTVEDAFGVDLDQIEFQDQIEIYLLSIDEAFLPEEISADRTDNRRDVDW